MEKLDCTKKTNHVCCYNISHEGLEYHSPCCHKVPDNTIRPDNTMRPDNTGSSVWPRFRKTPTDGVICRTPDPRDIYATTNCVKVTSGDVPDCIKNMLFIPAMAIEPSGNAIMVDNKLYCPGYYDCPGIFDSIIIKGSSLSVVNKIHSVDRNISFAEYPFAISFDPPISRGFNWTIEKLEFRMPEIGEKVYVLSFIKDLPSIDSDYIRDTWKAMKITRPLNEDSYDEFIRDFYYNPYVYKDGVIWISSGTVKDVKEELFYHNCNTVPENNGSAILNVDGKLVGINYEGVIGDSLNTSYNIGIPIMAFFMDE